VNRLSGGERQRVLLARALATGAPLQLWDEPLASLDPRHSLEVLRLAYGMSRAGSTVLLSLQDLRLASCLDAVALMDKGRLRAFGPPGAVLTDDSLAEVFGVRARTIPSLVFELK
jgi:iron complex transport system ATP-binding protein